MLQEERWSRDQSWTCSTSAHDDSHAGRVQGSTPPHMHAAAHACPAVTRTRLVRGLQVLRNPERGGSRCKSARTTDSLAAPKTCQISASIPAIHKPQRYLVPSRRHLQRAGAVASERHCLHRENSHASHHLHSRGDADHWLRCYSCVHATLYLPQQPHECISFSPYPSGQL